MSRHPHTHSNTHCSVVGPVGILIQLLLGILSFSVLIIKRHFENPKRPWRVWRYDTIKQVISQMLAHFLNLTISMALTSEQPNSDTCLWYFTTNIFDNTVGVFICVFMLRKIEKAFIKRKKYLLISGNYYEIVQQAEAAAEQPKEGEQTISLTSSKVIINYRAWFYQLAIWNCVFIISKIILFILQFFLRKILDSVSQFLLGWIEAYPNFELVFVIVVIPVIMNGFAFWVQDNFLKKRDLTEETKQAEAEIEMEKKQEQCTTGKMKENEEVIEVPIDQTPPQKQNANQSMQME